MTQGWNEIIQGLLTALGVGLLIGLMRERRKDDPDSGPSAAGLRTHALAAVASAVAWQLDERAFLVLLAISGALIVASYHHTARKDVGLTGEFALVLTTLIGALAMVSPGLAGALGVATALLLHLRTELHHLGRELISEQELHDGLLLAASALIVLPLLPSTPIDPWSILVPAALWKLVVLVMAAGVAGQVALRIVGARYGLPVAGFFSGFASSTAATAGYGDRAKANPQLRRSAVSAALFANFATLLLLVAVLAAGSITLLRSAMWPLAAAAFSLLAAASVGLRGGHASAEDLAAASTSHAFKLTHALGLAAFVAALLLASALLTELVGEGGALAAAALAGMVELQGAALVIGQLADAQALTLPEARWGLVALLATSATAKSVLAFVSGGIGYGWRVTLGLAAMVAAAGLTAWLVPA